MNRPIIALCVAAIAAVAVAAPENTPKRRRPPHPVSRPSGGIAEKPHSGKVFRILNMQSNYAGENLAALTKDIRYSVLLPIEVVQGEPLSEGNLFDVAEKLVAANDVGAGAIVVDSPKLPIELVSPDRRWGILNIAPLKADKPDMETFNRRFTKVYWGIIARTLGAGNSSFPGCVLVPFSDMKGLDAISVSRPCPEPFNKMIDTGNAFGIETLTIATYRTACQQGWAPAPTNDIQKAIWDEYHQLPTKPITIEYDPKKGK